MKKFFVLLMTAALFAACETPVDTDQEGKGKGSKPTPQPEAPKPSVVTGNSSAITETAVTLDGSIANYDGLVGVEAGVMVSTSPSVYEGDSQRYPAETVTYGKFSVNITGLARSTKYYFRAYLSADGVFLKGNSKSFSTLDIAATATVSDTTAYSLTGGTTVSGNVKMTATQTYPLSASLFWGKGLNTAGKLVSEGTEVPLTLDAEGNFTAQFGPFEYDATYYYVVKATVLDKTAFSQLKSFSTPGFEAYVTTYDATNVGSTTATCSGSYTVNYNAGYSLIKAFLYSTVEGTPQYWVDNNLVSDQEGFTMVWSFGNNPEFSGTIRNLKPSTTYYYAAAVGRMNDDWSGIIAAWYGNVKSFTTTATQP